MKPATHHALILACAAVLPMTSCSNKKAEAKAKELEEQVATLETEHESAMEEKHQQLAELQNKIDKAKDESDGKIAELTRERDNLSQELRVLRGENSRLKEAAASKAKSQLAADPVKDPKCTNALVLIPCSKRSIRGFVANDGGKSYLYTTSAVLDAVLPPVATTADGRKITRFGHMGTLPGTEIVRLELPDADDAPALTPASPATQTNADTKLSVLSLDPTARIAEGVLTQLHSQASDSLQTDFAALTGKTGAAVLDAATGQVLGMVTPAPATTPPTLWDEPAPADVETLTVIRLNRTLNWQSSPVGALLAERKRLTEFDQLTRLIHAFAAMKPSQAGLEIEASAGGGTATIKSVLASNKNNQVAVDAITLHAQLSSKSGRIGESDLRKRITSLYEGIASLAKRDAAAFDVGKFSPAHRAAADRSRAWRESALEALATATAGVEELNLKPAPAPDRNRSDRHDREAPNNR